MSARLAKCAFEIRKQHVEKTDSHPNPQDPGARSSRSYRPRSSTAPAATWRIERKCCMLCTRELQMHTKLRVPLFNGDCQLVASASSFSTVSSYVAEPCTMCLFCRVRNE